MKKALILLFFPISLYAQNPNQATIKGVITYFFNEYQGDKADIGAKVYVVDSSSAKGFDEKLADRFMELKYKRQNFHEIDSDSWSNFFILTRTFTKQVTVNGNGEFSVTVKPGTYYVYIVSNGRSTKATMCETMGKVFYKKIAAIPNDETELDFKFDVFPYDF